MHISAVLLKFQSPLLLAQETGSAHDETSSSGNKEDEDDDDDEGEDKIDPHQYDPERLKAFNVSITRNFRFGLEKGESFFSSRLILSVWKDLII
jgi:hypothetical protein